MTGANTRHLRHAECRSACCGLAEAARIFRTSFDAAVAEYEKKFEGGDVPRPAYWTGYRIVPLSIEFWHDRPFRKHDRIVFTRTDSSRNDWTKTRLYP